MSQTVTLMWLRLEFAICLGMFLFPQFWKLLESHGWVLQRTWPPYFVFVHPDHALPLLIPVHEKKVSRAYVEKIQKLISGA